MAQEAARPPAQHRADLGDDGEGDFLRGVGADVEPDRAVEDASHLGGEDDAFIAQIVQQPVGARLWAKDAEVADLFVHQLTKQGQVLDVVVGHHHRRAPIESQVVEELRGTSEDDLLGFG